MIRGYMETSEVAQDLGITTEAVLKLAHRGTLKSNFLAGRRLFDPVEVEKLKTCPDYQKRSRRGSQPVKDSATPSLFGPSSREPGSAEASQTASGEAGPELKAKEF